mgnify:CR=1 FL=1
MAEWSPEARQFLESYLEQVRLLAQAQGDTAQRIEEIQQRLANQAEQTSAGIVGLAEVQRALDAVGTPAEAFASGAVPRQTAAPPPPPPPPPQYTPPARSGTSPVVWAVLGCGCLAVLLVVMSILAAILLPALARARESARRASCQGNLKQAALVLKIYAEDQEDGLYPPANPASGVLMMDPDAVYAEYLVDPAILHCPSDTDAPPEGGIEAVDDHSYLYLGYAIMNLDQLRAYVKAYEERGGPPTEDPLVVDGVELRRFSRDPQEGVDSAEVPVVIGRMDNHIPGGANVLYLDGHTEFLRLGSRFPVVPEFYQEITRID